MVHKKNQFVIMHKEVYQEVVVKFKSSSFVSFGGLLYQVFLIVVVVFIL